MQCQTQASCSCGSSAISIYLYSSLVLFMTRLKGGGGCVYGLCFSIYIPISQIELTHKL